MKPLVLKVPTDFKVSVVKMSEIPEKAVERKAGRWHGWKHDLLQYANSELDYRHAIEIEAHVHASALVLRKDMNTMAARISKHLKVAIRGSKVYIFLGRNGGHQ